MISGNLHECWRYEMCFLYTTRQLPFSLIILRKESRFLPNQDFHTLKKMLYMPKVKYFKFYFSR